MRDVSVFQGGQAKAARRRLEVRKLAYAQAFGEQSFFARNVQPEFAIATGILVSPSSIVIQGYDSLRQTSWVGLLWPT